MPNGSASRDRHRILIAQEAARILAEDGVRDFLLAKRKAVQRLGLPSRVKMPRNIEVEEALREHQRLFHSEDQGRRLREFRRTALEAMDFLARFQPRLVGSVLAGTAAPHSDVNLHLFAETPEDVVLYLMDHDIPFEASERRLKLTADRYELYPVYRFSAGGVPIDLTVFSVDGLRQSPLSPVDGRPMQRAGNQEVKHLIDRPAEPIIGPDPALTDPV